MNDIFYHITSASLSWNPFIHFLHTIQIIPPPDIVTGLHILCLIYFSCTIQSLIKQEQRSPHSWCHYTNFQKGAAPPSSPLQRDHRALSLARGPGTPPPIFGFLNAFWVNDHLLHPRQHSLATWPPVVCAVFISLSLSLCSVNVSLSAGFFFLVSLPFFPPIYFFLFPFAFLFHGVEDISFGCRIVFYAFFICYG